MRNITVFLLAAVLAVAVVGDLFAQRKKSAETVVFVTDIHCENCKQRIEKNLPFEKGVSDVIIDVAAKTVTVSYDSSKTDAMKLQKAVEKLGYKVEAVKTEPATSK